jgi:hypothetical protein
MYISTNYGEQALNVPPFDMDKWIADLREAFADENTRIDIEQSSVDSVLITVKGG